MRHHTTARGALRASVLASIAAAVVALSSTAVLADTASDQRATFVAGSPPAGCAQLGLTSSQIGTGIPSADGLAGTVGTNTGSIQTGVGQELNLALSATDVNVLAVVVAGAGGYNRYDAPHLPPTSGTPQHYLAPLGAGGTVPSIASWFACYAVSNSYVVPAGIAVTRDPGVTALAFTGSSGTATNVVVSVVAITIGLGLLALTRRRRHLVDGE